MTNEAANMVCNNSAAQIESDNFKLQLNEIRLN